LKVRGGGLCRLHDGDRGRGVCGAKLPLTQLGKAAATVMRLVERDRGRQAIRLDALPQCLHRGTVGTMRGEILATDRTEKWLLYATCHNQRRAQQDGEGQRAVLDAAT